MSILNVYPNFNMSLEKPKLEKIDTDLERSSGDNMEKALDNFNAAIDKFPFLRGKMKAEILQWLADNINLQGKAMPFYLAQTAAILLLRSGSFDQYIDAAETMFDASADEIYVMGLTGSVLVGQAVVKTQEKLKSLLGKNG